MVGPEQDLAQEPEGGERPWERPGAVRRDCVPHRGHVLLWLGAAALVCGTLSLCLAAPSILALALGSAAYALARRDLARMAAGAMDPGGKAEVEEACGLACLGLLLAVPASLLCGLGVLYLLTRRPRPRWRE